MEPITSIDQISSDWLSETLNTPIKDFEIQPAYTLGRSKVYHIILNGEQEPRCFLKFLEGKKEISFYTKIAKEMPNPPIINLINAKLEPKSDKGFILLENLANTHFQTKWPIPPRLENCYQSIDILAHFHAYWWDHPRLKSDLGKLNLERSWRNRLENSLKKVSDFLVFLDDRLSSNQKNTYYEISDAWMALTTHRDQIRPNTLTHCDSHAWNFLYPKDIKKHSPVLFDWHSWEIDSPTNDIAYFMGLHWYPDRRKKYEMSLLRRYFDNLIANGVKEYNWDDCLWDYKLSIIRATIIPVWQWTEGIQEMIWWPHLERGMMAFEDLNCKEILST